MALYTDSELRIRGTVAASTRHRTATAILKEDASGPEVGAREYDIFLSHSFSDAEIILGIRTVLVALGLSVYVDWIEDPQLDRSNISIVTADRIRKRMRQSKSLIYAHSINSPNSKWMPWELGYFDGFKGAVAILPISKDVSQSFKGQEFLGLYPYIDKTDQTIWLNRGEVSRSAIGATDKDYVRLIDWFRLRTDVVI